MNTFGSKFFLLLFALLTVCFKPFPAAAETPVPAGPQIYTVQEGDSCWSIVTEFGVPLDLFLKINNMDATCPLYIGMSVIIPGPDQKMPTPTPVVLDQYQAGKLIIYEVEINDTYEGIASKFNTTLDSIRELNDIEDIDTFPTFGQVLIIAVNLAAQAPSPAKDEGPVTSGPQIYTVQEGDNCWSIVTEFGVPLDQFLKVNNLDATCPLYIGKLVIIPAPDQEMPTPTPVPAEPQIYTVQDDDSCWSIVTEFGVPLDLFLKVNNLDATCPLSIGMSVIIPGPDQIMPTPTPVALDQYQPGKLIAYEVEINDTYEGIASKFNTTLDSIRELNDIEDIDTFPTFGQVLIIAVNLAAQAPSPAAAETPVPSGPQIYTVQEGDNCWTIVTEFNVPLDQFLKVNNLDATCPLYVGKLVIIPAQDF